MFEFFKLLMTDARFFTFFLLISPLLVCVAFIVVHLCCVYCCPDVQGKAMRDLRIFLVGLFFSAVFVGGGFVILEKSHGADMASWITGLFTGVIAMCATFIMNELLDDN